MKTVIISAVLALGLLSSGEEAPSINPDQRSLTDLAVKHFANVATLADDAEEPEEQPAARREVVKGLQPSSLTGSALQTSSGLGSAARGLTPAAEWKSMFKRRDAR